MFEVIILGLVLLIPLGLCLYYLITLRTSMTKMKLKLFKNSMTLRMLYKNVQSLDNKMNAIHDYLINMNKQSFLHHDSRDQIEHQYERAKKILKNGSFDKPDILQSCNMTPEEMELLSGLINNHETI